MLQQPVAHRSQTGAGTRAMRSAAKRGRGAGQSNSGRYGGTQHAQHDGLQGEAEQAYAEAAEAEDAAEDVESQATVIMAAATLGTSLGVAVYDALANAILCCSTKDAKDKLFGSQSVAQTLQVAMLQMQPEVLVISSKDHQAAEAAARATASTSGPPCHLLKERAALFQYGHAVKRLAGLSLHGMAATRTQQEHVNYINTLVDLSCEPLVSALGALLAVMQRRHSRTMEADGEPEEAGIVVQSLSEITLQGCLVVDEITLHSLQIFAEDMHPSQMGIGKPKEGFSVYCMMQAQCKTPMGKRLMRSWLLRPVADLVTIQNRQDTVQLLLDARDVAAAFQGVLHKVQDNPRLLQRLSSCQLKPDVACFKQMHASLGQLLSLRDMLQQLGDGYAGEPNRAWTSVAVGKRLLECIPEEFYTCCQLITDVINFDPEEDILVKYGICQALDELRDIYLGLPDLLTKVLESELARVPGFLARDNNTQLWSILYLPQVGYVMQVSGQPLSEELLDALSDFSLFMEGQADDGSPSVYYYTAATKELSSRIGDVLYKIQDLESTLCTELVRRLMKFEPQLHAASLAVAELDCLLAFASVASNQRYCRPQLVSEPVLEIQAGRHPLAELLVDTYIPNDTTMEADAGRVHVITGPNASGKSCYIKSVALIVYLAHLGSFVPATKAVVGLVDRIFTRLVSQDCSRSLQQSTFMVDLSQVAGMLHKATAHSLIICDEFGKGTLTYDGVGLLAASLRQFCEMELPPRVLSCTHFHELFVPGVMPESPQLSFFTMDVISTPASKGAAGDGAAAAAAPSIFLYRLVAGHQTPSFGFYCARMCGVPEDVIQRAQQVVTCQEEGTPLPRNRSSSTDATQQEYEALVKVLLALDLGSDAWQAPASRLLAAACSQA